ncbi:hypothetical protein, partial [Klebsiella pneumoniae]|uniref:hypothetical protein n=1 Tax=Klebsiella pneumoniae TaxID=573 RepID=UPI003A89FE39
MQSLLYYTNMNFLFAICESCPLENRNSIDGFPITQSTDFPNTTHYQNTLIGRYDFDLNET